MDALLDRLIHVNSRGLGVVTLVIAFSTFGCTGSEGDSNNGGTGGSGAVGGSGTGGTGGSGNTGGEEPPLPTPEPPPAVFDSGTGTMISPQYELDVSIGGPVGKGKADSAQYMLDYYIPMRTEQ